MFNFIDHLNNEIGKYWYSLNIDETTVCKLMCKMYYRYQNIGIKLNFLVDCKLFHSRKFPEDESLLHRKLVTGSDPF